MHGKVSLNIAVIHAALLWLDKDGFLLSAIDVIDTLVQSASGAICRSRLLTVTTTLRQQGRDVWEFLEQAWIAHHRGGVMPSLLSDP